jgi:hypothetical protein
MNFWILIWLTNARVCTVQYLYQEGLTLNEILAERNIAQVALNSFISSL